MYSACNVHYVCVWCVKLGVYIHVHVHVYMQWSLWPLLVHATCTCPLKTCVLCSLTYLLQCSKAMELDSLVKDRSYHIW